MDFKTIMCIFGTRPEAIKMVSLVKALQRDEKLRAVVVVSAQHRQMLDQVLSLFDVKPDFDLDVMKAGQTLSSLTSAVTVGIGEILEQVKPDMVLVHGDTTTTFAAALASYYHQIPIGHVEAGLRTWDKYSPFPEEMNRQLVDALSDLYFAPTQVSRDNLLQEHHRADRIFVTGNTAIDAMYETIPERMGATRRQSPSHPKIVMTMHRRENWGEPMAAVFRAVNRLVTEFPDLEVVFPIHKNPLVRRIADEALMASDRIKRIEPLDVKDFHELLATATLVLADSGGIQEEAPALGLPVLVLRDTTERPEGVAAGTLKLVGTQEESVYREAKRLLTDATAYEAMRVAKNPYGDGQASGRIVAAIKEYFEK